MIQIKFVEKTKTHILWYITFFFFSKIALLRNDVKNISRAGEATDDRVSHAQCMVDN